VILHDPKTTEEQLPKLAIRPYPTQYVENWKLKGGTPITIRPIRPEDEPAMVGFHEGLSERSVYLRYFGPLKLQQRVAHTRLLRICFNDYDREIALVAERSLGKGRYEILGVGRMSKVHASGLAEFAVVVIDKWQNKGLGTELTKRLIDIARNEKLKRLVAYTLLENKEMQHMCKELGFQVHHSMEDAECSIVMDL
jgi:acetyltransferase